MEEFFSKFHDSSFNVIVDSCQIPLVVGDGKNYDTHVTHLFKDEASITANNVQNPFKSASGKNPFAQDTGMAQYYATPAQQNGYTTERSRMQLKSFIEHKAEETYVDCLLPLVQDRRRISYWQFVASASSQDPGSGRIFKESLEGSWRLIDTEKSWGTTIWT